MERAFPKLSVYDVHKEHVYVVNLMELSDSIC